MRSLVLTHNLNISSTHLFNSDSAMPWSIQATYRKPEVDPTES